MSKIIQIIGTGPAGLMAGTVLAERGFEVHFFDHKAAAARKFLVAGNGGFNLTHAEEKSMFVQKYDRKEIQEAFLQFTNEDFISFLRETGIETYCGSSGKIFPLKGIKPIQVLQSWLKRLENAGAQFHFKWSWQGFEENHSIFERSGTLHKIRFDHLVLALGGASWKQTGSTGEWIQVLKDKGILCNEFQASNSGFEIKNWEKGSELAGQILKNCVVTIQGISKKGEVVLTAYGIEGTPIYFLNRWYRKALDEPVIIDLKPEKSEAEIVQLLQKSRNTTEGLKLLKLSKTAIQLIKFYTSKETFVTPDALAQTIKRFALQIEQLRPIDEVISTIGGVSMNEIDLSFQLKKYPNISVCGEMLDWDAPTGGYLIQACVSSGYIVGKSI